MINEAIRIGIEKNIISKLTLRNELYLQTIPHSWFILLKYFMIIYKFRQDLDGVINWQPLMERFVRTIDELVKIKSKKYKHESEKYFDLDKILEQVNIPSKMLRQTYYQVIQSKK